MSTARFPLHLCLVSEQTIPNLVPALDPSFRPEMAVLVVSPEMQTAAFHLETVLGSRGVPCQRLPIADAYDADHTHTVISEFLSRCDCGQIALNATGGTKIMAFAAQRIFLERGLPVFYVHPERDQIVWLHPSSAAVEILDSLVLEEFLRAHGFYTTRLRRDPSPPHHQSLSRTLVAGIETYARPLSLLNYLAGSAEHHPDLRSDPLRQRDLQGRELAELLSLFADAGLLVLAEGHLLFPSEEARFFVNGGWLEQHIFDAVLSLGERLKIRDCARGVVIHSESGTPNELDVAFLSNNRLHLIECKTRRFARDATENSPGAETLYKMDSLRDLGGAQTRSLLISYQELSPWDRQRARDLHITTLAGPALRNLEYELLQWISG